MKMDKTELLTLANQHFNNWLKATVELKKCYKDANMRMPIDHDNMGVTK